jgi:mono/diheme cytochrome c family protein
LTPDVISAALKDADGKVRATAVRLSDRTQAADVAKLLNDPSVDVQVALAFHLSTYPETQDDAIALARRSGGNPLVCDALLSGLRGRELEVLQALVADSKKPAPNDVLGALAQAVMNERRSARVKKLLELIVAQPANSPAQVAMLNGAAGIAKIKGRNPPKHKILYLEAEAPELVALAAKADAKSKPLVAGLDARIAWPGKPGVPPPPVIVPLTAQEQQLFDTGKTVYTTLCAACHQPTGTGMEGLAPPLVDSEWVLGKPDVLPRIVLHGLSGPVKVNGQSFNLEMPPLGPALNDEQIAGVLTYIRREWEHNASPISVATVASLRSQNKDRTKSWSSAELMPPAPRKPKKDETPQDVKN